MMVSGCASAISCSQRSAVAPKTYDGMAVASGIEQSTARRIFIATRASLRAVDDVDVAEHLAVVDRAHEAPDRIEHGRQLDPHDAAGFLPQVVAANHRAVLVDRKPR